MMKHNPYLYFYCSYCDSLTVNETMVCDECQEVKDYYTCSWMSDIVIWLRWMFS